MEQLGFIYKSVVALIGTITSYLFGGWSLLLGVLLTFVILDYLTGIITSALQGKLSSQIGVKGITKKLFIFIMVAVAHLVDIILGGHSHLFRDAVIFFYVANELLSIIENIGQAGVPIPSAIRKAVQLLKEKSKSK